MQINPVSESMYGLQSMQNLGPNNNFQGYPPNVGMQQGVIGNPYPDYKPPPESISSVAPTVGSAAPARRSTIKESLLGKIKRGKDVIVSTIRSRFRYRDFHWPPPSLFLVPAFLLSLHHHKYSFLFTAITGLFFNFEPYKCKSGKLFLY